MNFTNTVKSFFVGLYKITNDSGRITIPFRFREVIRQNSSALEARILFYRTDDGVIRAVPYETSTSAKTINSSEVVKLDKKGRIWLPKAIRDMLRLEQSETVMLMGSLDCFELWSHAGWAEIQKQAMKDFPVKL
jgi:DNA-binding transcriptional regulator/RsmH inhibitor MraZ